MPNRAESTEDNLTLVAEAIARLEAVLNANEGLEPSDQVWLTALQDQIGRESVEVPNPEDPTTTIVLDCTLTVEKLNQQPGDIRVLFDTLRTVSAATSYQPAVINLGGVPLAVHNDELIDVLRAEYTPLDFLRLFGQALWHGTFNEVVNPDTGLVQTTTLEEGENPEMLRQWVTDTMRCGDLQRYAHPRTWPRALKTVAAFYNQPAELEAFDQAINDPAWYRDGGPLTGVAHIFIPQTLARDEHWFNNKRLESHGLALKAFSDTWVAGLVRGKRWGFRPPCLQQPDDVTAVVTAMSNLAAYLLSIQFWDAPSAGPWEETPFPGGQTWDTEAVRSGLEALADLMFNPSYADNWALAQVRQALRQSEHFAVWGSESLLTESIAAARQMVIARLSSGDHPVENPLRPIDASLVFVSGSTIALSDDPSEDVQRHFDVLAFAEEELVRQDGIIRYAPFLVTLSDGSQKWSPDSYLAKNYWIGYDKENKLDIPWRHILAIFGSKDASDVDVFLARAAFATPDTEAEWFMVSDMAFGYAHQTERLLRHIAAEGRAPTDEECGLLARGVAKSNEYINRSFARLTPPCDHPLQCIKANGRPGEAYAVPEAYETVSTLDNDTPHRRIRGSHTPLAWARASLFRASQQFASTLVQWRFAAADHCASGE